MDTVRWAFENALVREGRDVVDHTGAVHRVLFRRNKDKNDVTDNLTFFHRSDSGIMPGYTLTVNGDSLIVLNSEHESGTVYRRCDAVRANGSVSLCYVGKRFDEHYNTITADIPYAENVPIFIISGLTARRLSDLSAADLQFIMPARYGISTDNTAKMNILEKRVNGTFRIAEGIFQPSTIDYSLMKADAGGGFSGLLTVRGSADLSPRED